MRGEIIGVWSETWREIWEPLAKHKIFGKDLIPDLYREFFPEPRVPEEPKPIHPLDADGKIVHPDDVEKRSAYETALKQYNEDRAIYEEIVSGGTKGHDNFKQNLESKVQEETSAVWIFEKAHNVIVDYGDDDYTNKYFLLAERFLQKYSLRYDLRRPFTLHPTLSGLFSRLFTELKTIASRDVHLNSLFLEFEDALRDLKLGTTPSRMKTCMQKQFNLIEALSIMNPGVTKNTLGAVCGELNTWPHENIREAAKKMYGFGSDYPGIRHGGKPASALRDIEMRDLVAVSILLAGFAPYLTDQINSDIVYRGS
jgi:hypothetical protein